jgi:hypothetical protein
VRRHVVGIVAALALGVGTVIAVQAPALASVKVCTAAGNKWCLSAYSLAAGTPIVNDTGRNIILQDQGHTSGGYEVYRMVFSSDQTKCVGLSSNGLAEVRDCSGGDNSYVNWQNDRVGGISLWHNTRFSYTNCVTPNDPGSFLTSDNSLGDRVYCSGNFRSGDYIAWTPSPTP